MRSSHRWGAAVALLITAAAGLVYFSNSSASALPTPGPGVSGVLGKLRPTPTGTNTGHYPPPPPSHSPSATISISISASATHTSPSRRPRIGGIINISAGGFLGGEPVLLELHSKPVKIGEVKAATNGTISDDVKLPAGVTGSHHVVAIGMISGHQVSYPITIDDMTNKGMSATAVALTAFGLVAALFAFAAFVLTRSSRRRGRFTAL